VIVAIASCPNPPLLLPGITGRPVAEVEQLRSECLAVIGELIAIKPDEILVVGGHGAHEIDKPLSVTVGRSLLAEADCPLPVEHFVVPELASTEDCLALGRELAGRDRRTALLVMADGSARRNLKAPGYLDERAVPFDERVSAALASGDGAGLAALDAELANDLLVAGRAAWQVLAGVAGSRAWQAELPYSRDPFGVWYPVAIWTPAACGMSTRQDAVLQRRPAATRSGLRRRHRRRLRACP
jgi:hypothetical protein